MNISKNQKLFIPRILLASAFILAAASWSSVSLAQTPFETVRTRLFTMHLRDVRNMGMGGVGVSDLAGRGTGYYNPAGLVWSDAFTFGGSCYEYVSGIDFYDAGVSGYYQPGGGAWEEGFRFGWAASYWALVLPGGEERTIFTPEGTDYSRLQDYYLTCSLAAGWKSGIFEIGIGEATKFLEMTASGTSMWAFDLGVIAAAELEGESGYWMRPRVGFSAMDLGSGYTTSSGYEMDYIRRYRVGAGIDYKAPQIREVGWMGGREVRMFGASVSIDLAFDDAGEDDYLEREGMFAMGLELTLYELLHLRAGISNRLFLMKNAASLGLGLEWNSDSWLIGVDYGLVMDDMYLDDLVWMDNFRLLVGWKP